MWGRTPKAVKCPRNDCEHYDCKPDEYPCSVCTCNRRSDPLGRSFRFQRKGGDIIEVRERTESRVAEQEQAAALAADRVESRTGGTAEQS